MGSLAHFAGLWRNQVGSLWIALWCWCQPGGPYPMECQDIAIFIVVLCLVGPLLCFVVNTLLGSVLVYLLNTLYGCFVCADVCFIGVSNHRSSLMVNVEEHWGKWWRNSSTVMRKSGSCLFVSDSWCWRLLLSCQLSTVQVPWRVAFGLFCLSKFVIV